MQMGQVDFDGTESIRAGIELRQNTGEKAIGSNGREDMEVILQMKWGDGRKKKVAFKVWGIHL